MADNLFRKVSLERISSPEQLDTLLVIIKLKGWIALLCLLGITMGIIIWSIMGSIPITAEGNGILLDPRGLEGMYSTAEGQIVRIPVRTGDEVRQGDPLIILKNPAYDIELKIQENKIHSLQTSIERLQQEYALEKKIKDEEFNKKIKLQNLILDNQKAKLALLEKELAQAAPSHQPDLQKEILQQKALLEEQVANISIRHSELMLSDTTKRIDAYTNELYEQTAAYELLKLKKESLEIKAPQDGRVIEIDVELGQEIGPGAPLLWLQAETGTRGVLPFYCFVPLPMGEKIEKGMTAHISFLAIDSQQYGQLLGRVERVLPYAASINAQQLAGFPSRVLKEYLGAGRTSLLVLIDPILDPHTPSGYKWTTQSGPPNRLPPGSIGTARIILEVKKPISYALPIFKDKRVTN